jgi:hypothetical protein
MELVNLKSLTFNSYEGYAELIVEVKKESLSYLTSYLIDVLQINKILNFIQKNNDGIEVNDLIQSKDYIDFQEYFIDLTNVKNVSIWKSQIELYMFNSYKKQIRA